jgi:transcriptional regulator with XRE-family HTH domain
MSNYSINLSELGYRVKTLRLKQHKTQEYFADLLYISPSYLALIENGKRTPTIDVLALIAKVCDVSMDYLLFGEPSYSFDENHQRLQRLIETYPNEKIEKALSLAEYYLSLEDPETTDT